MPSPRANRIAPGTWSRSGPARDELPGSGTVFHVTRPPPPASQATSSRRRVEVGIDVRDEAVQAAVVDVLAQVDVLVDRVDAARLVLEDAEPGGATTGGRAGRVALPHLARAAISSHDSQVPHGVGPPAQLTLRVARGSGRRSVIVPAASKRIADTPPMPARPRSWRPGSSRRRGSGRSPRRRARSGTRSACRARPARTARSPAS